MAKRRRSTRRARGWSGPSQAEKQQIIDDYMAATGAEEFRMVDVARWAIANGRWPEPPPYDPVKACADALSDAAREQYYTDPQGRSVRKKHCYVVIEPNGQRRWNWVDIETANPNKMHKALQARRRQAFGDIVQLDTDRLSYNDNNLFGAQIDMSYNFDEDLAELRMPTDYPDAPESDGSDDTPPDEPPLPKKG